MLCDPPHQELLRVEGATGKLLWRLVVGQPIVAGPVRADKWLLLVTKDDRLLVVDVATGDSSCYFQLPQAVRLPPLVDATHGLIVLVAEHSNLIVLDMQPNRKGQMPAGPARGTRGGHDRGAALGRRRLPYAAGQRYAERSRDPRLLDFSQTDKMDRWRRCRRSAWRVRSPPRRWPWGMAPWLSRSKAACSPSIAARRTTAAFPGGCFQARVVGRKVDPLLVFRWQHVLGGRRHVDALCSPRMVK